MGQIVKAEDAEKQVLATLNRPEVQRQMAAALPSIGIRPETFARWCVTALRRQPQLRLCNQSSLLGAMVQSAQLGLDPSGVSGEAYLLPFGKEVTFVPGYKGLVALMYRSGSVTDVNADVVREGDEFAWEKGTAPFLRHKYGAQRGKLTHAWCVATIRGGGKVFTVLTAEDIEKIKKSSASARSGSSPWSTHEESMWMKSAVRRNAKLCPVNAQIAQALAADEDSEERGIPSIVAIEDFTMTDAPTEPEKAPAKEKPLSSTPHTDEKQGKLDDDPEWR